MFDKLVESTRQKSGRRAGRYVMVTTAIYALALVALVIGTVIGFSPALAEEYSLTAMLEPPVPRSPSPPPLQTVVRNTVKSEAVSNIFAPPVKPTTIPDPTSITPINRQPVAPTTYSGFPPGTGAGLGSGIPGGSGEGDPPKPPPPPIVIKPTPTPAPEIKHGTTKVSEGVLQGSAIRKPRPMYPVIAKTAHASGPVQVVVTISEDGRVVEANAVSGHALLRSAAVDAARQWVFTPTKLSNVPVKVQGVLTFNFVLE